LLPTSYAEGAPASDPKAEVAYVDFDAAKPPFEIPPLDRTTRQ